MLDFPEPLTQAAATGQPRNSESQSPMSLEAATHHTQMNYCRNIRVDITDHHYSGLAKYCDAHVCVSVCLSLREHISETARPIFTNFLCMLPAAVARYFSVGVAIRYVLPVSWTTSCLRMPGINDATTASTQTDPPRGNTRPEGEV